MVVFELRLDVGHLTPGEPYANPPATLLLSELWNTIEPLTWKKFPTDSNNITYILSKLYSRLSSTRYNPRGIRYVKQVVAEGKTPPRTYKTYDKYCIEIKGMTIKKHHLAFTKGRGKTKFGRSRTLETGSYLLTRGFSLTVEKVTKKNRKMVISLNKIRKGEKKIFA